MRGKSIDKCKPVRCGHRGKVAVMCSSFRGERFALACETYLPELLLERSGFIRCIKDLLMFGVDRDDRIYIPTAARKLLRRRSCRTHRIVCVVSIKIDVVVA